MNKSLLLAPLFFLSHYAYSQDTPETLVTGFFKEYSKAPSKAVENLYSTNTWVLRNRDAVEQIKSEINKLTTEYVGQYYGYEFIVKKQIAGSFVLQSYLVRYDRQPLRFTAVVQNEVMQIF